MSKQKITYQEKLAVLKSQPKLKAMHYTVLVLLGINILLFIMVTLNRYREAASDGSSVAFTILTLLLIALMLSIFWWTYKLRDWVKAFFWLWFMAAFSGPDIIGIIIGGIILFFYYYVTKMIANSKNIENKQNSEPTINKEN